MRLTGKLSENMIVKLQEKGTQLNADPHTPDYLESIQEKRQVLSLASLSGFLSRFFVDSGASIPNFKEAYRNGLLEALSSWSIASQNKTGRLCSCRPLKVRT